MSAFHCISVDCIAGDEFCSSSSTDCSFKSLDKAIDEIKSGNKILIYPGNYAGSHLASTNNIFQYELDGTGLDVELGVINHEGFVDGIFRNMKIRDVDFLCSSSNCDFYNVSFIGSHTFKCKGYSNVLENPTNDIEFTDCTFGINFQFLVESGMYNFTFKNCKFRSKVMPIFFIRGGNVEIKTTLCNFNAPIVINKRGSVYIYHNACNFTTELWTGKECSVFSRDNEVALSALKSYKIEPDQHKVVNISDLGQFSKTLDIDTEHYQYVELRPNTEFVRVFGPNSIKIDLPDTSNILNGHKIEILRNGPIIIINDIEYFNVLINIRFITNSGWIFY
jgi:hypothetical protein